VCNRRNIELKERLMKKRKPRLKILSILINEWMTILKTYERPVMNELILNIININNEDIIIIINSVVYWQY